MIDVRLDVDNLPAIEAFFNAHQRAQDARVSAERAALRRFRRAMRRHEKRARAMGLRDAASTIAWHRRTLGSSCNLSAVAECCRAMPVNRNDIREAFLFERAADAVARLRQEIDRGVSRSS